MDNRKTEQIGWLTDKSQRFSVAYLSVRSEGDAMSKTILQTIQCTQCGYNQETTIWESINVTVDPQLKEKFFAGEINIFECENCGEHVFINAPLLYHDMTGEFCVQYYPFEALAEPEFLRQFNSEGFIAIPGIPALVEYLIRPHIVFDMTEMIRYVIFRDQVLCIKEQ